MNRFRVSTAACDGSLGLWIFNVSAVVRLVVLSLFSDLFLLIVYVCGGAWFVLTDYWISGI